MYLKRLAWFQNLAVLVGYSQCDLEHIFSSSSFIFFLVYFEKWKERQRSPMPSQMLVAAKDRPAEPGAGNSVQVSHIGGKGPSP